MVVKAAQLLQPAAKLSKPKGLGVSQQQRPTLLEPLPHTEGFQAAMAEVLVQQGLVDATARIWLRLKAVQCCHASLEALQAAAVAHGNHVVGIVGIIQGISTKECHVYSQCFA